MTSLRTFQHEIDEIQHREVAKQRTQALAEKQVKEQEKEPKKGSAKAVVEAKYATSTVPITISGVLDDDSHLAETTEKVEVRASIFYTPSLRSLT